MSKKIHGFITVRSSSSRLPNKCFFDFFGINVLEHIILRCKFGGIEPVVCTTNNKKDDKIAKIAKKIGVKFFRGSENNKILRWMLCCKKFKIKKFHTIDADDLFFDWNAIKRSMIDLSVKKQDMLLPSSISRSGGASEGYSITAKALKKFFYLYPNFQKNNFNTEMIEPFFKKKIFKLKIFKGMSYEIKNVRLTLDYQEDYNFLRRVAEHNGSFNERKNINFFLKKNLKLSKINLYRSLDWKKKQDQFVSNTNHD
jgi:spore coat polysaccharide biosynthesis protein SpsF